MTVETWEATREIVARDPGGDGTVSAGVDELRAGLRAAAEWFGDQPPAPTALISRVGLLRRRVEVGHGRVLAQTEGGEFLALTVDGRALVLRGRIWEETSEPEHLALLLRRAAEIEWMGGPLV